MKDEKGKSPFLHATTSGNLNTFECLLEKGVDPESSTSRGYSPLHCAAEKGYTEILTRLLSRGINVNGSSEIGTPLDLAANLGQFEAMRILLDHNANCVELLLQAGADPNCGSDGINPLTAAAIVTSRITEYADWSVGGVIRHVHSDQAKEQRKLKAKERFHEAKLCGADAFKKQDYFQAMICYSQANEIGPHDATVLSNRSMCWARMKDGKPALDDAIACISLRPDWPKGYYRAGVAYNLLKRYSDAQKAFLEGLKLSPNCQELKDALREAVQAQLKTL
ncbi:protein TANC2-like isoform X2 [Papaver somniferum]|nr:protein TANC2-like isoform X2 [Papaver somniferum]